MEFAIENAQALKKRAMRQGKVQAQVAGRSAAGGDAEAQEGAPSSRKEQRKRKRDDSEVCICCQHRCMRSDLHDSGPP